MLTHENRSMVVGYGQRCNTGWFDVVLQIISGVHAKLGTEYQLTMPPESFPRLLRVLFGKKLPVDVELI